MIKEIKELESKLVCRFPELADMSRILSKWITEELLVRLKLRIEELEKINETLNITLCCKSMIVKPV